MAPCRAIDGGQSASERCWRVNSIKGQQEGRCDVCYEVSSWNLDFLERPNRTCNTMLHSVSKVVLLSSNYRLKLITSLWPVAFAMRSKVRVEGRVRPFSSRTTLACAVLSFAANSVCDKPAALRAATMAAPSCDGAASAARWTGITACRHTP